jgi:hypothetical protein
MENNTSVIVEMNSASKDYEKPNLRIKIPLIKDEDINLIQTPALKRINPEKISMVCVICTYLMVCTPYVSRLLC